MASKDISCDATIISKPFYHTDITCRDFSVNGYNKNSTIARCVLMYYSNEIYIWGWRFPGNTEMNFAHSSALEVPTERSCSMKIIIYDDMVEFMANRYDNVKGKMQIFTTLSDKPILLVPI